MLRSGAQNAAVPEINVLTMITNDNLRDYCIHNYMVRPPWRSFCRICVLMVSSGIVTHVSAAPAIPPTKSFFLRRREHVVQHGVRFGKGYRGILSAEDAPGARHRVPFCQRMATHRRSSGRARGPKSEGKGSAAGEPGGEGGGLVRTSPPSLIAVLDYAAVG